jgi:hypothetical protein
MKAVSINNVSFFMPNMDYGNLKIENESEKQKD